MNLFDRRRLVSLLAVVATGAACGELSTATNTGSTTAAQPASARAIQITPARFFPEGVAVDKQGNFYVGSMELGAIYRATASAERAEPFIEPDDENQLVSALGLYVDDASSTLYACSSDAGNAARSGKAPAAIKAFDLATGKLRKSYAWPKFSGQPLPEDATKGVTGFCNDLTMDGNGNLYATDSWYPRILKLRAGGEALEEWIVSKVFPQSQWHLNGLDVDRASNTLYAVENHPGALYAIAIAEDGSATTVEQLSTSRPLLAPDGLKVAAPGLLVVAEGGNQGGAVSVLHVRDKQAELAEVGKGLNQVATLAPSMCWMNV